MAPSQPVDADRRYYTVDEANKALPLVQAIVTDIVQQWQVLSDLEQRLAPILERRQRKAAKGSGSGSGSDQNPESSTDPYAEELASRQAELESERLKFQSYLRELEKLGVELKGPHNGLCDFPSIRDGREVYLCWKLGEPQVQYWHELHAGYAGRQPIEHDRSATESSFSHSDN